MIKKRSYLNLLLNLEPSELLTLLFLLFIAIGTLALKLPIATYDGISFIDALFTATSAACVTGLMVVDLSSTFTMFGQIVILILIQVGGLGIMTFSVLFTLVIGKSLSMRQSLLVFDSFDISNRLSIFDLISKIIKLTLLIELIGGIALFIRWMPEYGIGQGLYYAIFHAVSGFCNAGITLFSDNLLSFADEGTVPVTIALLSIIGSLGFITIVELYLRLKLKLFSDKRLPSLSLQTKIILSYSFVLVVGGGLLIVLMESGNLFANMSFLEKLSKAFFVTFSSRTAGFNTVEIGLFTNGTLAILIILMIIGASPGSVGGGIKITTFGVLIGLAQARFFGYEKPSAFKRTIPDIVVTRSIAILFISTQILVIYTILLLITETGGVQSAASKEMFLAVVFDVVSAFGTVGMSAGATEQLSELGKLLISSLMLIGRLGPLTITIAVAKKPTKGDYQYAEENIMVG
ncbi:MAG: TrkH family potassium uptake protein [Nitrospinota bacterium]